MSFEKINANNFRFAKEDYANEFQKILSKIILCYYLMLSEKIKLENDENKIRDYILKNYLKKESFKKKYELVNYLFDSELPENKGRVDIRVIPVNPLINDDAYYIIECKRLDDTNQNGISGFNAEYIKEGIYRFVSKKYSSYFSVNGMIGFIVSSIDINKNVESINRLLNTKFQNVSTVQELKFIEIVQDFKYSYHSMHTDTDGNHIALYHLMLDFSKNINI